MIRSIPDLCDANPDLVSVLQPMLRSFGGRETFSGRIETIKCHEDNSKVKQLAAQSGSGKVMVIDGGGSLRRALLGDMIAREAQANGWEGLIFYGCVRDVEILLTMDIGVLALAAIPLKTDKRDIGDIGVPVTFGGITFHPDHYLYADPNGVIVAPRALS